MIEPVEAEMARPAVFTPKQEAELQNRDAEGDGAGAGAASSSASSTTLNHGPVHPQGGAVQGDIESGNEKYTLVEFEPGTGEDPKEWGKGKKWRVSRPHLALCLSSGEFHPVLCCTNEKLTDRFTTMIVSLLCLTVAIGSAMPTGDLPGQARDLGVSNIVIYLSITLFVVGFGVGPLLFAPCE